MKTIHCIVHDDVRLTSTSQYTYKYIHVRLKSLSNTKQRFQSLERFENCLKYITDRSSNEYNVLDKP